MRYAAMYLLQSQRRSYAQDLVVVLVTQNFGLQKEAVLVQPLSLIGCSTLQEPPEETTISSQIKLMKRLREIVVVSPPDAILVLQLLLLLLLLFIAI